MDLDPRDFEVALAQAKARLSQAENQVTAQERAITQVENTTNISTGNPASRTRRRRWERRNTIATPAWHAAEAEANSAKAQSDLARYKILTPTKRYRSRSTIRSPPPLKHRPQMFPATKASVASANQIVDQRRAQLEEARSRLAQYQQKARGRWRGARPECARSNPARRPPN